VKNGLEIVPVSRMDEVVKHALTSAPAPIKWKEPAAPTVSVPDDDQPGVVAH
jgi:ATP-dependent Lon protease